MKINFRQQKAIEKKKSYRKARMQRQNGHFDTWSSPLTSNSIIVEAAAKFSKRKNSTTLEQKTQKNNFDNKYNENSDHFSNDDNGSLKINNDQRRRADCRPLNELLRFKSELQLNFSKKVFYFLLFFLINNLFLIYFIY